jgi:hypothetical protein
MTYDEDPTRWTSSPEEAPELLRGAFSAAQNEGPNRAQMRSLALKIAAASAGGAVAIGTVKAASAGHAMATAATWSAGKIGALVAIAGTLVTGGAVIWQSASQPNVDAAARERAAHERAGAETQSAAPVVAVEARGSAREQDNEGRVQGAATSAPALEQAAPAQRTPTPSIEKLGHTQPTVQLLERAQPASQAQLPAKRESTTGNSATVLSVRGKSAASTHEKSVGKGKVANGEQPAVEARGSAREQSNENAARASLKANAPQSEIELLHRAQVALQGRPREAYQLTQEHRRLYPNGEFTQERDALAIQALMRAGDSDKARDLAQSFIRTYPSSPHAHRFREAMGLR